MNLQNKIKKAQSERGFTIVELLIVIVVIGILAAIVIVAFNGVQDRAKSTQYSSDASGIVKAVEALNADNQAYPTTAAAINGNTTIKLPDGVTVAGTPINAAASDPTSAAGPALAAGPPATRTYTWKRCGSDTAPTGIAVFFSPVGQSGTVKKLTAGTGC